MNDTAKTDRGRRCEQDVIHLYQKVNEGYGDLAKYIAEKVKYSEIADKTDYSVQHVGNIIRRFKRGEIKPDPFYAK